MNNKGEMGFGMILVAFITVIVGIALFAQIASDVGSATSTRILANESLGLGVNGSENAIPGQAVVGSLIMTNQSGNTTIASGNYSTSDKQVINGVLTATVTVIDPNIASETVYLWYTAEPDGYLDATSRAIAPLILVFFALAIAVVALVPAIRNEFMSKIGK